MRKLFVILLSKSSMMPLKHIRPVQSLLLVYRTRLLLAPWATLMTRLGLPEGPARAVVSSSHSARPTSQSVETKEAPSGSSVLCYSPHTHPANPAPSARLARRHRRPEAHLRARALHGHRLQRGLARPHRAHVALSFLAQVLFFSSSSSSNSLYILHPSTPG